MAIEIKRFKPTSHKIKALVYGASGSGKTSFAGTAKNAIFLSAEGGLLSIASTSSNEGKHTIQSSLTQSLKSTTSSKMISKRKQASLCSCKTGGLYQRKSNNSFAHSETYLCTPFSYHRK